MSKVKMLLDVVNEVKKEAPEDVPNWNAKLAESKVNLKNQLDSSKKDHYYLKRMLHFYETTQDLQQKKYDLLRRE